MLKLFFSVFREGKLKPRLLPWVSGCLFGWSVCLCVFLFFCLFGCFIARFLHQFSYFAVGLCVCWSVSVFLLDFSFGFYTSSPIFGFLGVVDLSVFFLFVCLFA